MDGPTERQTESLPNLQDFVSKQDRCPEKKEVLIKKEWKKESEKERKKGKFLEKYRNKGRENKRKIEKKEKKEG